MQITKHSTAAALTAMASVVITSFVVAALYLGREMLIPLALAALLAFLLNPLVARLERWIGRIAATLLAVSVIFVAIFGVGWVLTSQVIDLATQLPNYKENILLKMKSLSVPGDGRFTAITKTVEELKEAMPGADSADEGNTTTPAPPTQPGQKTAVAVPQKPMGGGLPQPAAPVKGVQQVQIVESRGLGPLEQLSTVLGPLVGPLGTGALVLLLLFCMLLQREDLRGRLIRLVGSSNISATTRGMDDAAQRVSRYLLMQLIVNASYGVVIAIGLYFIGVPSAFVWGILAAVLRFIPYIGAWIAAAFPIILSLAVSDSWMMPIYTVALFLVVELLSNNVMEPMLYGSSTGVSSIALIIAAVFWTWIWGAAGLVLATPLTVCLVVMGHHVPRLSILSVLLSDAEALAPHQEFYHRLLTPNTNDSSEYAEEYLKKNSRTALYDTVFIPALAIAESDQMNGQLEKEQHASVMQELRDVVIDLGARPVTPSKLEADKAIANADAKAPVAPPAPTCRVLTLPVRADRDEISGMMLTQLLQQHNFPAECLTAKMTTGELLEAVNKDNAEVVCISVAPPSTVVHARYLCGKLRAQFPKLRIVIGFWGATEQLTETTNRLRETGADEVVTSFADAVLQLSKFAAVLAQETILLARPSDETQRLEELRCTQLLDTPPDPRFDHITKKLTRIINVPIALVTLVDAERQFFKAQTGLPEDLATARETPRDVSVCNQVVISNEALVVEDLARDRRFANNSLLKEKKLRFYAGTPLRTASGNVLGALCVLDYQPRKFDDHELRLLQVSAEEVMELITQSTPAA